MPNPLYANHNKSSGKVLVAFGIGILAVIVGLILMSRSKNLSPTAPPATKASSLKADQLTYDFGTISMAKGKVTTTYKVKNPTDQAITISKVYTSCMCTKTTISLKDRKFGPFSMPSHGGIPAIDQIMAPGEEAVVEAVFDPAAHGPAGVGPIVRNILVESTDGGQLSLEFKAQVTP